MRPSSRRTKSSSCIPVMALPGGIEHLGVHAGHGHIALEHSRRVSWGGLSSGALRWNGLSRCGLSGAGLGRSLAGGERENRDRKGEHYYETHLTSNHL